MAQRAFVSTNELAEIFGVTRRTIMRWREAGLLPEPIRMQRRLFWPMEGVAAVLREKGMEIE
jgi:DNA-binding transcriptional MerR regulator